MVWSAAGIPLMTFFLVILCFVAVLPLLGFSYQSLGKLIDRRRFPAPGRYVEANGQKLHIVEKGSGPAVVFEAGIASSCLAWATIEKELAKEFRVITYDRAGFGWSGRAKSPRTLENIVNELHALLEASGVQKPYLLVGHSYGGLIVRNYATRFPDEVSGLLLVDPVESREWMPMTPSQSARLQRGVTLSRRGALLARFGVVRFCLALVLAGSRRLPRLIARWSAGRGASTTDRLAGEVKKLPPSTWPMIRMHWSDERCFATMADYLELLPANVRAAVEGGWPSKVPALVLTVERAQHELPVGVVHRIAYRSGHWIQLDEPELVIAAIRELLLSPAD
jgi:pimeloyl-ACP methyl ester carboxylesterase